MAKLTLQQLESYLWKAADILRGYMAASEFKDYVLGKTFLKSIADLFWGIGKGEACKSVHKSLPLIGSRSG